MSIYSELILDHYQNPRNFGKMINSSANSHISNTLCGDEIDLSVKIVKNKIIDAKFIGKGCAVSIASTSMLTEFLKGKGKEELKKIDKKFIIEMLGIELGVNRIKCALMPLEALNRLTI